MLYILFFVLGCGFEKDEAAESDGVACGLWGGQVRFEVLVLVWMNWMELTEYLERGD